MQKFLSIFRIRLAIFSISLAMAFLTGSHGLAEDQTQDSSSKPSKATYQVTRKSKHFKEEILRRLKLGEDPYSTPPSKSLLRSRCEAPTDLPGFNISGSVEVPEDYSLPEGQKIRVFYYGKLVSNMEPIVFFNGGPGSDSHSSAQLLSSVHFPTAQNLSWIFIDQRGTGCSSPFPEDPTPENVERLTHYTSEEIVKDAEVIREKLLGPHSKWKVFGQSFGGLITHRYALIAPQSIKAAYAHGFSVMNDSQKWLELRVRSQKRVLASYLSQYPDDEAKIRQLRSQIPDTQCFSDGSTQICGNAVTDALTIFLGFTTSWPRLHTTLASLVGPDGHVSTTALNRFVDTFVFGVYNNNGLAGSVISMIEISASHETDQQACLRVNQAIEASGDNPQDWLINECRLLGSFQNSEWDQLLKNLNIQKLITPEFMKNTLVKNPQMPFYLYSGQNDVFVPVETFAEEVNTLGALIHYTHFMNSGHEGFSTEAKVWKDIAQ